MEDKKLRPYGDISVVTGKYIKDGKERNRYHKVGTLFATPHLTNITIKLDSNPMNDGWLKVFKRDDWQEPDDEAIRQLSSSSDIDF